MREINKICIVSGSHRSGTTWIGHTIAKGTNSAYIWEPFNVKVPLSKRSGYGKSFLKIDNWYHLVENSDDQICIDLAHLLKKRSLDMTGILSKLPNSLMTNPKAALKWLMNDLKLSANLKINNSAIIKDPIMLFSTQFISKKLGSKCILITKDPRSFYNSLKKASWGFDFQNIYHPCRRFEHLNEYIYEVEERLNKGALLDPQSIGLLWNILHKHMYYLSKFKNFKIIKYEEICEDPVFHLDNLAFFATNKKLSKKIKNRIFHEQIKNANNSDKVHIIRHENSKEISKLWCSQLNKNELIEIEKKCDKILSIFNYDFYRNKN